MESVMEPLSLTVLAREQLAAARSSTAGRSAHTIHGGRGHALRQTVLALADGRALGEHESPGEATLYVLVGHVRLVAGDQARHGSEKDYLVIPPCRHDLVALEDSVVLLSVAAPAPA